MLGCGGLPSSCGAQVVSLVFPVGVLTVYMVVQNFHTPCSKKRAQKLLVLLVARPEPGTVSFQSILVRGTQVQSRFSVGASSPGGVAMGHLWG